MGDSGVDQREELSFCFRGVVEDLLRNVNEAKHNSVLLAIISLDVALLDLDKLEFWNVLFIYIFHAWQVFHDNVDVLACRNHLSKILSGKSLIKCEDLRVKIPGLHVNDISDRILSFDIALVCAVCF